MFITDCFTKANITGDKKHLEESLKILDTLYNGWTQAVESLKKKG
jgi:flagellin-specific chaperone FliS